MRLPSFSSAALPLSLWSTLCVLALTLSVRATVTVTGFAVSGFGVEGSPGSVTVYANSNNYMDGFYGGINWGDGTGTTVGGQFSGSVEHTYANNGTYTISFGGTGYDYYYSGLFRTRYDQQNGISASATVIIQNAAPSISTISLPAEVRLSAAAVPTAIVSFAVSGTDLGANDVITGIWDFENDGTNDFNGLSGSHVFTTAGTYTVKVKVVDNDGAASSVTTRQLVVLAPRAPVVNVPSSVRGTVTENFFYQIDASDLPTGFDATNLPPGLVVDAFGQISGIPKTAGEYHVTLSATNLIGTTQADLIITIVPIAGSFSGLISASSPTHETTGFCRITTTATGKLTAVATFGGKKYTVKGGFAADGAFIAPLTKATPLAPNPPQLTLQFHADEPSLIDGTIVAADVTSTVTINRELVFTAKNPAPLAGSYTFLLPQAGSASLRGHGYGSLKIATTGKLTLVGALSDGTVIKQGAALTGSDTWPLFALTHTGKGSVQGQVTFLEVANTSDFAATLRWYRPEVTINATTQSAIATNLALIGSKYQVPSTGASAIGLTDTTVKLDVDGAPGLFPMNKSIHIEANLVSGPAKSDFTMSLAKATGLFKGTFFDPVTFKATPFVGALLQKQNIGQGLFKTSGGTGSVDVGP